MAVQIAGLMAWRQTHRAMEDDTIDDLEAHLDMLVTLHKMLIEYFNENELITVAFNLGVNYDTLASTGLDGKARELVNHLDRRRRLRELIAICQSERPNINWPVL